ncbi:FAD-dependent oxidoreductase [Streptococcus hyovaginalis]
MKIIIVGGVAGGMSAATRLRRLMEDAEIVVFDKGPYVSFANCGLPYHLSGEIEERSDLLVQTPERLKERFQLDVRPESEVTAIDPVTKTVTVGYKGQSYRESYDRLILSPGAKPVVPNLEGLDKATNVFTLRNIPDLDYIMTHLKGRSGGKATLIGAGFIGLEMTESLVKKGFDVTIIEKAPHVLPSFDQEMAAFVRKELLSKGVTLHTNQSVKSFKQEGKVIVLDDGTEVLSDVTILSVGVTPETSLAASADIELGLRGGILVDQHYETNQKDIFAVGDAIVVKNQITEEDDTIALASPANRQGRQVADILAGIPREHKGSIGTAIVRVFNLVAASTGINEIRARENFEHVAVVHTNGKDHASYFPGATDITIKLVFNPKTGAIYGAQAVGQKGVDKRIDVLATAIKVGMTIFDLPELELTYAPPFGSAKDPVNMIGYAASNLAEGQSESIQWYDLKGALAQGSILIDVRNPGEVVKGRFADALNIPLDHLRERLDELDHSKDYIVSCHSGLRSYIAERLLKQKGFKVRNLDGAYSLYQTALPEEMIYD